MLGLGGNRTYPTVLLIDDDHISREVIATILTLNGYMLHTAAEGVEALAMLDRRECEPQVILVDVQMPGLNGVPLVAELRSRSKSAIYAISGTNPPDDLRRAVDGFLLKPLQPGHAADAARRAQPQAHGAAGRPRRSGSQPQNSRPVPPDDA